MSRLLCLVAAFLLLAAPLRAQDGVQTAAAGLAGGFAAQAEAVDRLGALGDPRALPILRALSEGRLQKTPEGVLVIGGREALTGAPAPTAPLEAVRINNRVRGALRGAFGRLELAAPEPAARIAA
ncbi:urea ABC transporter permease subunit UrtB, partial [Pseudoroseomonas wenyumeiae]